MKMFNKRNRTKPATRIVRRAEQSADAAPLKLAVARVLTTQRWDPKQGEFRGFESPPGRF